VVGVGRASRTRVRRRAAPSWKRLKYELPNLEKGNLRRRPHRVGRPDKNPPATGRAEESLPEWQAELLEIWISAKAMIFRGRHEKVVSITAFGAFPNRVRRRRGLRGDQRIIGYKPDLQGAVTFFDADACKAVREHFSLPDYRSVFRRNLIRPCVDLGAWVGSASLPRRRVRSHRGMQTLLLDGRGSGIRRGGNSSRPASARPAGADFIETGVAFAKVDRGLQSALWRGA
jgi:hypothetical protein